MWSVRNRLFVALLAVLAVGLAPAKADDHEIVFGSVAMDIPAVMHVRLKPLTDYLSTALGRPVRLQLSANLSQASGDLAGGRVHLAYLTPIAYVNARAQGNVRLVAKTVTKGQGNFKLMIVARENAPIRSVEDLAGKDFAFGDRAAILQRAVVVGAGMPLERLRSYRFLGHYDNIARGVLNGDFQAGILKDTTAYAWAGKGLRIVYASPDLPPYNIAAHGKISDSLLQALRKAFLSLNPANRAHLPVIRSLDPNYDGFAPTDDAEYEIIRQLTKPFAGAAG